jgi:hypothetical protein
MKNPFSHKNSLTIVIIAFFVLFAGPSFTFAATTPSLGVAATYAILSSTYTNVTSGTTVNGDIGFTTPPAVTPLGIHTSYGSGAPYAIAGIDQNSALSALTSQMCTFTFAPGAIDFATDTTHGPVGVYTPGVYCTATGSAASIGTGGIVLSGNGTYIFRINGAFTTVANSAVTLQNGASSCNVFWTPTSATTLGANSSFIGTIIDAAGITVGANTVWAGAALAFGGTVTTDTAIITATNCTVPPAPVVVTPTPVVTPVVTPTVATTTVTTVTPTLPNTGIGPDANSAPWSVLISVAVSVILFSFYFAQKKQYEKN